MNGLLHFGDIRPKKMSQTKNSLSTRISWSHGIWLLVVLLIGACNWNSDKPRFDFGSTPILEIHIDSLDFAQMIQLRDGAVAIGVMDEEVKQEFPCLIEYEGRKISADIRFKGDWTDHLETGKWSYRISLKDRAAIYGKRTFSIQHPATRGFGQEWVLHQLLEENGILSTYYDFVPVKLNGEEYGLYAFEEHFEKQLLEGQNRREGVILKFDESSFWTARLLENRDNIHQPFPEFESCIIEPFKKKKTLSSFEPQLILGNNLAEKYRSMSQDLASYLDVERFAMYYAVITLGNSRHGTAWHNQRWYVNPVTARLEPIGYDCYGGPIDSVEVNQMLSSIMSMDQETNLSLAAYFRYFLFKNERFQRLYLSNLERLTEPSYLASFFEKAESEIDRVNALLGVEFGKRKVERDFLEHNASIIRKELPRFKEWLDSSLPSVRPDTTNLRSEIPLSSSRKIPVRVYSQGGNQYVIENNGGAEINVFAFKDKKLKQIVPLDKPAVIGTSHWRGDRLLIHTKTTASKFYYRLEGDTTELKADIIPWPAPVPVSNRAGFYDSGYSNFQFVEVSNDEIRIRKGNHRLSSILYIPEGKRLVVEAGTVLNLEAGGGILSESEVILSGTPSELIIINSNDPRNQGFTVLQATNGSALDHVVFQGLSNLSSEGWVLTGGVNFYESPVTIANCKFLDSRSEDALNIIRSDFSMDSCLISNTFADGFDADFSTGTVSNSRFQFVRNDGLDFSGSTVSVYDCHFQNISDKAISCGEKSTIEISDVVITEGQIGIAAKDLSHVLVHNISIELCEYGLVAYTKKVEYGGATIEVSGQATINAKVESDIELGSTLIKDGKVIKGENYSSITKY